MSGLTDFLSSNAGGLLSGGIGAYGYKELMDRVSGQQDALPGQLDAIRTDVRNEGSFTPWSVRSGIGTSTYNPTTGMQDNVLSGVQQGETDYMREGAQGMFNLATQDPAAREAQIYDRIRSMQQPEEQRAYDSMNANLFSSGRGGMATEAYGGSPEQMAFAKAQAEARNTAGFNAMGQAQNEMNNYANIGNTMFGNQYQPYQNMQAFTGQGLQNQNLVNQTNNNMAGLMAQLGLGQMTTDVNYGNVYSGAFGKLIESLAAAGSGLQF